MKCPICQSKNIRKDYDFPETMRACEDCGSEWVIDTKDSSFDITLNTRDLEKENRKCYTVSLMKDDQVIDSTSVDEKNDELAWSLFREFDKDYTITDDMYLIWEENVNCECLNHSGD